MSAVHTDSGRPPLAVALVTPGWPQETFSNGITKYVAKMRAALVRAGVRVEILTNCIASHAPGEEVIDITRFARSGSVPTMAERLLRRFALQHSKDRWVSHAVAAAVNHVCRNDGVQILQMEESFGWARAVKKRIPVPVVVRLHGPWFLNGSADGVPEDAAYRRRVRQEGRAIAFADGITAPSQDVLERTRAQYGLALDMAEVIPNPRQPFEPHEHWTLDACDANRILFVGRFDRHKGGDVIVDAFAQVLQQFPAARLSFVGPDRGFTDDGGRVWNAREYIENRLPGALEAGRVEWHGEQPNSAIPDMRRKALVTVVCSRWENFANTATEAFSLGCPLVVSNAGGLPEIVQDGANGLWCRPGNAQDLAAQLCRLLGNHTLAQQLGRQAALDSIERYTADDLAQRTVAFYERVIARASGRAAAP